jgi:hypothetical protein
MAAYTAAVSMAPLPRREAEKRAEEGRMRLQQWRMARVAKGRVGKQVGALGRRGRRERMVMMVTMVTMVRCFRS